MACNKADLQGYLSDFAGQDPVNAVLCPFVQTADGGLGLGLGVLALLTVGPLGLAMAVRSQHPGPLLVAGMLTIGAFSPALPGQATVIAAIVFFFGIVGLGFYLYNRASNTL